MYTDTHAHFPEDAAAVAAQVSRAVAAGVTRILAVGGNPQLNAGALAAATAHPQTVALALGWDRDQAGVLARSDLLSCLPQAEAPALRAWGEIGLDYHYHPESARAQCELLEWQLELAAARSLPVLIHTRAADADTLAVLRAARGAPWFRSGRPGVIHCFTGGSEFAAALLELDYYLSFSGIVTFANATPLRAVAAQIPADRLLIETDAPYLTPVPLRGQPNEPAFVTHVAAALAAARGVTQEELAAGTTANAQRLFGAG